MPRLPTSISFAGRQTTFPSRARARTLDNAGNVTFSPTLGFVGNTSVTYLVGDNNGGVSNAATLTITVQDGPAANDDPALTLVNTPVTINVTANDIQTDNPLTITRSTSIPTPPVNKQRS